MCGRFSLFAPKADLEDRFDVTFDNGLDARYNIAPRDDLDVVPNDDPEIIEPLGHGKSQLGQFS